MKKMFSLALTLVLMLTLSVSAFAATPTIQSDRGADSSEVQAKVLSVSKTEGEIGILTTWTIEWTIPAGRTWRGLNVFTMPRGDTIDFDVEFSPQPGIVRFGLWEDDEEQFEPSLTAISSPFSGSVTAPRQGRYSFAIQNTTDTTITVVGSYTY